jgi:hypothetical protein
VKQARALAQSNWTKDLSSFHFSEFGNAHGKNSLESGDNRIGKPILLNPRTRGCCLCIAGENALRKRGFENYARLIMRVKKKVTRSNPSFRGSLRLAGAGRGSLAWQNGGQPGRRDLFALRVEEDRADRAPIPPGELYRLRSVCHLFPGWSVAWPVRL